MEFHLDDMTCGGCARAVTRAIKAIDPAADVVADPPTHKLEVRTVAPREQIIAALREAGFPPRGL